MAPTNELGFNASDPCVIFDQGTQKWHAYFSSEIQSLGIQVIKHAESSDHISWTVHPENALSVGAPGTWDSMSVETCSIASVQVSPGHFKYFLYYSGTNTLNGHDTDVYKIGLAISDNPNTFTRITAAQSPKSTTGLLFDETDAFSSNPSIVKGIVTDPEVLYSNAQFQMWFYCAGAISSGNYVDGGICFATSSDGISWTHHGSLPSLLNEKSTGVIPQQPTVIFNSNFYEMWLDIDDPAYSSYGVSGLAVGGFYHATSPDGINWTYTSKTEFDFTWDKSLASEDNGLANGPKVVFYNNTYYLFYGSFTTQNIPASGYQAFTWGLNLATKN